MPTRTQVLEAIGPSSDCDTAAAELFEHAMQLEQEGQLEQQSQLGREGKESLVALGKTSASDERFDELAEALEKRLRLLVSFEHMVLLSLPEVIPVDDRRRLGQQILAAEKHVPNYPHPHAPKKPATKKPATKKPATAVIVAAASMAPLGMARDKLASRPAEQRGRAGSDVAVGRAEEEK